MISKACRSAIKRFLVLFSSIVLLFSFSSSLFAKTMVVKPSPTPTPVPYVNSFELFWPMSAGKTIQSKVYFLKTLKEQVRGFFIFGSAPKANYNIFVGIKRVLEAETLMKANTSDLANKTLDLAVKNFDKANDVLTKAKNSGDIDQGTKDEINGRVTNMKKYVNFLMSEYPNYREKLQLILERLNTLTV